MLKIERDPAGHALLNAYTEGERHNFLPIDPNSRAFASLVAFNSQERPYTAKLLNRRELIHYCKQNGIILVSDNSYDKNCVPQLIVRHVFKEPQIRLTSDNVGAVVRLNKVDAIHPNSNFEQDGIGESPTDIWITRHLNAELREEFLDDTSDIRRISSCPIRRTFVYVDVSEFSRFPPGQQVLVINSLVRLVKFRPYWDYDPAYQAVQVESMLCIGDGYIYVFKDPLHATIFAAHLAGLIETLGAAGGVPVPFHFRMGIETGPVYCFFDPGREKWNYIGSGINDAQRILSAIPKTTDDVIYVSENIRNHLLSPPSRHLAYVGDSMLAKLTNRRRQEDKHGTKRRVYELNHTELFMLGRETFDRIGSDSP